MLLEFSCKNFKSIHKKIVLSMLASTDDTREEDLIRYDNKYRVNRISAIYGANGSGKTNVLNALDTAVGIIVNSMRQEPGDAVRIRVHKLAQEDEASEFSFQYVTNGIRYVYAFSVLKGKIDEEYLYYFPNKRQTKIFSRKGLTVENGDSFKKIPASALETLKANRLFLACAANYTNNKDIENAFLFFKSELKLFFPGNISEHFIDKAIEYMSEHPELKEIYLQIADYLDTGIRDVKVSYDEMNLKVDDIPISLPDNLKQIFLNGKVVKTEAKICYDKFETDLKTEESTGIKKLFMLLYPYIEMLRKGGVLICDEIETGLHESVVRGILELFSKLYADNNAQLIFTTHDTSLLDSDLFRRDQIWFTELDNERSTDLYSLAEIRNVRKTENLKNGYISGKYGAIPMLNDRIILGLLEEANEEY